MNSDFSEILFKLLCQSGDMWLFPRPSHFFHKSRLISQICLPMMRTKQLTSTMTQKRNYKCTEIQHKQQILKELKQ